jgi:hypothetical protein
LVQLIKVKRPGDQPALSKVFIIFIQYAGGPIIRAMVPNDQVMIVVQEVTDGIFKDVRVIIA